MEGVSQGLPSANQGANPSVPPLGLQAQVLSCTRCVYTSGSMCTCGLEWHRVLLSGNLSPSKHVNVPL